MKKKQRWLLSLLIALVMIYFALPKLGFTGYNTGTFFSAAWILLALLVVGGNFAALLYAPKQQKHKTNPVKKGQKVRQHSH